MTDQELRENFVRNLNHQLEISGYSQADMSRHMKVSTTTAAKWCNGQTIPRLDKIEKLCAWLGCQKSDLLEDRRGLGASELSLTDTERRLIVAYRASSDEIQEAVCSILKVRRPASTSSAGRSA